jgi:hypothetical protein
MTGCVNPPQHSFVWDWAKANDVPETTPAWFDVEIIGDTIRVETWLLNESGGVIVGARRPFECLTHVIELPLKVAPQDGMIEAYQRTRMQVLTERILGEVRLAEVARNVVSNYNDARLAGRTITLWELLEESGIPPVWKALSADGKSDVVDPALSDDVDADSSHGDGYAAVRQDSA